MIVLATAFSIAGLEVDSSVPLTHHDPRDLAWIDQSNKNNFRILSDFGFS